MYQEYYHSKHKWKAYILRCRPEDIEIKILGNTLFGSRLNGMNGTFYDTPNPRLEKSCWGLAVNNGKPIGPNAHLTDWGGLKRGVVAWDGEQLHCRRINKYTEIPGMQWGISGVMLVPEYDRYVEKYAADVYRKTNHSILGFDKEGNVFLIVVLEATMTRLVEVCAYFGLVGAISLDGGGSSQLHYNGRGYKSSRPINSAIIVK